MVNILQKAIPLHAVKKAVLIGASTHILAVIIRAIMTGEWWRLNAFALLQIDLLFPQMVLGVGWFIISYFFFIVLISFFVLITHLNEKKRD
ncbi:hypothetical protein HY469_01810 [Candidatus Roizmanbacteria bacterium]|nr:hypothetical protein [Candidatus Roizmanbacteria bacterium]